MKVPQMPNNVAPYKTQKRLRLMRGPELFHNTLLHKQFGIIATCGGRLKHNNFEMIRMLVLRNITYNKAFVIWRVPAPWQPITKKSQGVRMGAGKGSIDHYVTPVKSGQVIIEVGGNIEYFEVRRGLINIAKRLPFDAKVVSQELMEKMAEDKKKMVEENLNPWNWKYIIQNNMLGCHKWISKLLYVSSVALDTGITRSYTAQSRLESSKQWQRGGKTENKLYKNQPKASTD
ncbi:39S ribosomal protein L16, mitochondrial [Eufriesea mexicana]|nr:39S ribosomal protein L16, mitochondrial [Eufriesea mexicana]